MDTIQVGHDEPRRTPVQGSVALSTTAANIGATITAQSEIGWELVCTAAWLVGTSTGQLRPVAANEIYNVPSSSLAGWYAKVGSGTPTLVATGAQKATS